MSCLHPEIVDGRCRDCGVEFPDHSWRPSSLIARASAPPEPPTIGGLLYPGKRTLLSGETESLKTWMSLILAKAEMDAGYAVAWADLDAMGSGELLQRLRALGVRDDVIDRQFLYYEPSERLVDRRLVEVCGEIANREVRLFIIDAFNGMLNLHGLDPGEHVRHRDLLARSRHTDHRRRCCADPARSRREERRVPREVRLRLRAESLRRNRACRVPGSLATHSGAAGQARRSSRRTRIRPGFLPRPVVGRLVLDSDGVNVTYVLEEDRSHAGDRFRPTMYMERVSVRAGAPDRGPPEDVGGAERHGEGRPDPDRSRRARGRGIRCPRGHVQGSLLHVGQAVPRGRRSGRIGGRRDLVPTSSQPRPFAAVNPLTRPRPLVPPIGDEDEDAVDWDDDLVPHLVPALLTAGVLDAAPECWKHGRTRHWRSKLGTVRCVECIAPLDEFAVVEWLEAK